MRGSCGQRLYIRMRTPNNAVRSIAEANEQSIMQDIE